MPKKANPALRAIRLSNLKKLVMATGSQAEFARKIDRRPQNISDFLAQRKFIGDAFARHIEESLGLAPGTLDRDNDAPETPPLEIVRMRRIPVYNYVQAGLPNGSDTTYDEEVDGPDDLPQSCYALWVRGSSMEPVFYEGQCVFIDRDRAPRPGDYVIARSDEGLFPEGSTLKKYVVTGIDKYGREIFDLKPENPNYPTLHSIEHKLTVTGVVCGAFQRF